MCVLLMYVRLNYYSIGCMFLFDVCSFDVCSFGSLFVRSYRENTTQGTRKTHTHTYSIGDDVIHDIV